MANWSDLKAAVASIVKTNGNKEITGQLLQNVLNNIISNVGLNSSFAGIATPETNPGTPDGNVFYLATTEGTYSNFNGIVINPGEAVILEWKGSWVKKDSGFTTKEKLSELEENTNQKLSELGSNISGIEGKNELNFDFTSATIGANWKNMVLPFQMKKGNTYLFKLQSSVEGDVSEVGLFARKEADNSETQVRIANYTRPPYTIEYTATDDYSYINLIVATVRANAVYTLEVSDLSSLNLLSLQSKIEKNDAFAKKAISDLKSETNSKVAELKSDIAKVIGNEQIEFDYTKESIGTGWVLKKIPYKIIEGNTYKVSLTSSVDNDITEIAILGKVDDSTVAEKLIDFQRTPYTGEFIASKNYSYICVQAATVRANAVYTLDIVNLAAITIEAVKENTKKLVDGEYDFGDTNFVKMLDAELSETNLHFVKNIGKKFRFSQKVVFPDDVHFTNGEFELFRISKGAASVSVSLCKALSTSKTSDHLTDPICPMPVYNAGLKLYINNSLYYETDTKEPYFRPDGWRRVFMLGEDAMTLRFKGDCSIVANQDIRLKIGDNNIIVYHQTNNSTIAIYPKSQYETMEALYNQMKNDTSDGALVDFEVKWISLDNYTPSDLIPCDVALVAEYQRDNNGNVTGYDAFPFYFTTKEVNKEYVIDVIFDKDNTSRPIQVLLNGHWIGCSFSTDFYNNDCDFSINNNVGGIITKTITLDHEANPSFPNLREFYYEGINEGLSDTGLLTSEKFVAGTAKHFKENGFSYITMDEMIRYLDGSFKPASNKLYHITIDDSPSMVVLNPSIRETFLRNKIYPSIVWWMKDYDFSEKELTLLRGIESCGFKNGIHAGPLAIATSISFLSYDDMVADVDDAIERFVAMFHTYPIFWNNHSGVINYNVSKYLRYKGFSLIQATNGFGGLTTINRYCLPHYYFKDGMDYNGSALSLLKSYINYSLDL